MPLPKRIKDKDLEKYGFERIDVNTAKHRQYYSFRRKCEKCQDWVSDWGMGLCGRCYREKHRAGK